jgi:hypothetical protein
MSSMGTCSTGSLALLASAIISLVTNPSWKRVEFALLCAGCAEIGTLVDIIGSFKNGQLGE